MLCQIWVTMIAYLLLSYMKFLSIFKWSINKLINVFQLSFSQEEICGLGSMCHLMFPRRHPLSLYRWSYYELSWTAMKQYPK